MIEQYISTVRAYPLLTSAIQVAILGTFGEILAVRIRRGAWYFFGPGPLRLLLKLIIWAFLGITFKYAFVGFFGFTEALVDKGFWFKSAGGFFPNVIVRGISVSIFINLLFGPVMILFHRLCDNAIEKKPMEWRSLQKAWWTVIWFWIPIHSVTFSLPSEYQIGLAAFWSMVLGVMLGFFARGK